MALEKFFISGSPTCRVVYPRGLFEKTVVKGTQSEPKYNAVIVVPKDDKEKMDLVNREYTKAFDELKTKGFKGKTPDAIESKNNCWKDGDKLAAEKEGYEKFKGYMLLSVASRNYRPIVTDMQKKSIVNHVPISGMISENISDEELKDGDYVFATVSFWTYNGTASGIGANIHAVKRFKEGEQIAGVSSDIDDYMDTSAYE